MDDQDRYRQLVQRLLEAGAGPDELARAADVDALVDLSIDVGIRTPGPQLTLAEVADRAGITVEVAARLCRTAGLVPGPVEALRWSAEDVRWMAALGPASALLGDEAVDALLRRAGAAAAQLAHGTASVFRVGAVDSTRDALDCFAAVERNLAVQELIDRYVVLLGQLLRHHSRAAVRTESVAAGTMGELRDRCVGFVDVTSSTSLGERVTAAELAALMAEFERVSFDAAATHGARVVKTIGDEVMLCADEAEAVCLAALDLVAYCRDHATFAGARGGVAAGAVLDQAGDCYGPVVNRAARFVQAAADGTVMADGQVASALSPASGLVTRPKDAATHRGLGTVPWVEVGRAT